MQKEATSRIPWTIMTSVCIMAFAIWAPVYCVPPMEHILKEELLLTHAQTSLIFSGPILMLAAVGIVGGFLADRIGTKKAIGIGAIIMVVGATLRSTANTASNLLVFTFIYGAGIGLSFPNLPKLVSGWVTQEKVGTLMGLYSAGMFAGEALALAITMPLVFPMTNSFQGSFLIWSIPLIAAVVLWWVLVREPPHRSTNVESVSRTKVPLSRTFRNKSLWLLGCLLMLLFLFFNMWVAWAPALMMLKGATPELAGLIASTSMWVGIPASLFMPRISDRVGLRKPFLWGAMMTLAISAGVAININLPLSWPLMAVVGIALTSIIPIIYTVIVEIVPRQAVGIASGMVISIGNIGALGPYIGGRIFDVTGSLNLSLIILVGVAAIGTGIAFKLPETGPKAKDNMYHS